MRKERMPQRSYDISHFQDTQATNKQSPQRSMQKQLSALKSSEQVSTMFTNKGYHTSQQAHPTVRSMNVITKAKLQ